MQDLVIVPTFDRPEFLITCLENLHPIIGDRAVWVAEDIHADKPKGFTTEWDMLAVINEAIKMFNGRGHFRYRAAKPHTTYGNSYNVLGTLAEAFGCFEKVYLIEDDVLVTPDFFEWNDEVHEKFHPWASCAGRLNRSLNFHMNGPEAIDENIKDVNACVASVTAYNSWATCFSQKALEEIAGMAAGFEHFRAGFEQDIMIQDHIRRQKLTTIWPYVPRAYHMGWYSYHREGMRPYGTLGDKVKALKSTVTSSEKIKSVACIQQIDAFPKKHHDVATGLYLR